MDEGTADDSLIGCKANRNAERAGDANMNRVYDPPTRELGQRHESTDDCTGEGKQIPEPC